MIGGVKTPPYERKVLNVTGYYSGAADVSQLWNWNSVMSKVAK